MSFDWFMGKTTTIIIKNKRKGALELALEEANSIRDSALRNAQDILFQAFSPRLSSFVDEISDEISNDNPE